MVDAGWLPRFLAICGLWSGLLAPAGLRLQAQSIPPNSVRVSDLGVQFQALGPTNAYLRVDSSSDLFEWLPVDLFFNSGGTHLTTDSFSRTSAAQFYRVLQVDPNLEILDFSPANGAPGATVEIAGQFYPPGSQYVVEFGGVSANVISGNSTRLMVSVPANAQTSQITVSATNGTATSAGFFVVSSNAIVRLALPGGLKPGNFAVENNYGSGTLVSNTVADFSIPVRLASPTLTFAAPPGQGSNLFFCAISFGADQVIVIDENSTAQALVFQSPNLFSGDPAAGVSLLGAIRTNAAVQRFAQALATTVAGGGTPYDNPAVTNAYQNAVLSVLNSEGLASVAASVAGAASSAARVRRPRALDATSPGAQIYPLEFPKTRFLNVTASGLKFTTAADDFAYNPVDWIVAYQDIDVDAAFPNGQTDFNQVQQTPEGVPRFYPTKGAFYVERSVEANLLTKRIDVTGAVTDWIVETFVPKQVDESVTLPAGDAMYLVRGVGPSFVTTEDYDFVNANLSSLYVRAVALNLASAAIDLAGALIDGESKNTAIRAAKTATDSFKSYEGVAAAALKAAPGVSTPDDFVRAVTLICESTIQDFLKDKLKDAAEAALKFTSKNLVSFNSKLKAAAGVGQVAERASGLFRATALETSLVIVGDPFALASVTVNPSTASPGQEVVVQFKGPASLPPFDPGNPSNLVTFEGAAGYFNGLVTAVSGPDPLGRQSLTVRIPVTLGATADGPYTLYVLDQGRKGSAAFTVSTAAALTQVTPLEGFPPAANFLGSPYPGTAVRLRGAVFNAQDTFVFSGVVGGIQATNVQSNTANSGIPADVTVLVPSGAVTGPIKILHQISPGVVLTIPGPVFTVLGRPFIDTVQPPEGAAIGTVLNLAVDQAGHQSKLIYAQFTGADAQNPIVLADGTLAVFVPNAAQSGFLSVFTPGGSNSVVFDVLPPVVVTNWPAGAIISVGGTSSITLARAIAFANGDDFPTDAEASTGISTYSIAPNNPTLWQLGPAYADTIAINGTVAGDATFPSSHLAISFGALSGNIVIKGDFNGIGNMVCYGPVTIAGNFNNVYSLTFQGAVNVTGASNRFTGVTFNGPVTVAGNNNQFFQCSVHAPMTVVGNANSFDNASDFRGVTGDALTIRGNQNTGTINCETNSGDGLRIDGGKYNQITVNNSVGNGGNGVTLTGGAEGNQLIVATGTGFIFGPAGSGNKGHGVALIGGAVGNSIASLGPNLSGNGLDGVYMDGAGVTLNTFNVTISHNGRNGITITNGASMNTVGNLGGPFFDGSTTVQTCNFNAGCGVVCASCGPNQLAVLTQSNGLYGVLISNVKVEPESFSLIAATGGFGGAGNSLYIAPNGRAALRLEQGTSGIQASETAYNDPTGVELDGADVTGNSISGRVMNASGNGVVIRGAHDNAVSINISESGADGVLLDGASNNVVQLLECVTNGLNGVHLIGAASGNELYGGTAGNRVDGCLVEAGSHDNVFDSFFCGYNRQDGMVFSGTGVSGNQYVQSAANFNGRDGIRFELGAANNIVGSDLPNGIDPLGELIVSGNAAAGIRIRDPGTGGNSIRRCAVGGSVLNGGQPVGIVAENHAGIGQIALSRIQQNTNGIVLQDGAHDGTLSGLVMFQNLSANVVLQDAANVLVGGSGDDHHNEISRSPVGIDISGFAATNNLIVNNHLTNATDGVYIHGGAGLNEVSQDNLIEFNARGIRIEGATNNQVSHSTIQNNQIAGIVIAQAASGNGVTANVVTNNGAGVVVSDNGSIGNKITGNSISGNHGIGIQLSAGGNAEIPPPTLLRLAGLTVSGTSVAADGSEIEIYRDAATEGQTFLGGGIVLDGQFQVELETDPRSLGLIFNLNGTVTDPDGNTSEFSALPSQPGFPLGGRLAFTSTPTGVRQIFYSSGGGKAIKLSSYSGDEFGPALSGSAGCGKIAFASFRAAGENIFVMDAVTNAPVQQVTSGFSDHDPAWLKPCQSLVFVSERTGLSQLYSVNLDGSGLRRLTTDNAADISPAPTPDGLRIVFISNRAGTNALWIMNADGSNQTPLASLPGVPSHVTVSPDGTSLALAVTYGGASEIGVARIDGGNFMRLTNDGHQATHPTWLPDGERLIFSSNRDGSPRLYSIDRSGDDLQILPLNPNLGTEPSAGP